MTTISNPAEPVTVHTTLQNPDSNEDETVSVTVTHEGVIIDFYADGMLAGTWAQTFDEIIEYMP